MLSRLNELTTLPSRQQIKTTTTITNASAVMSFLYDMRRTGCNLTSAFETHVFHLAHFYQSLLTLLLRRAGEHALRVCLLQIIPTLEMFNQSFFLSLCVPNCISSRANAGLYGQRTSTSHYKCYTAKVCKNVTLFCYYELVQVFITCFKPRQLHYAIFLSSISFLITLCSRHLCKYLLRVQATFRVLCRILSWHVY